MSPSPVRRGSARDRPALTPSELWYGRPTPLPPVRVLRIGPLVLELDGVDVARVRWGSTELVHRIYMSVRDRNWDTVLPGVSDLDVERRPDRIDVRFSALNRAGDIDFEWDGAITATADGCVDYAMNGRARSDFEFCRIGFCVLHGEAAAAGRRYRAQTPDGPVTGVLPQLVAPQEIVDGRELPLIPPCSSLEVDLEDATARLAFEGSLFSAEDQRNWTDASFKTCCIAGPDYPYPAVRGQTFEQRVRLTTAGGPAATARRRSTGAQPLEVAAPSDLAWPAIGLGIPEGSPDLSRREASRLARLGIDHVRVDLHLGAPGWGRVLTNGAATAAAVRARLEIALFLDDGINDVDQLRSTLTGLPVSRIIVLPVWTPAQRTTPPGLIDAVRRALGPASEGVVFAGGTDGDFAELNRDRPSMDGWDAVSYSVNPQVHAFDNRSLAETLATQATTVETARSFAGSTPIMVSPITLRQRFNPSAIGEPTIAPGDLPATVDVRQMSLFGAGWTLGSIASLTGAGVASMTYFETVGWRGVIDSSSEARGGGQLPSPGGIVYPMYHVFEDLSDRAGRQPLVLTRPTDDLTGIAMTDGRRLRVLVGNVGASRAPLTIGPFARRSARLRVLDDRSAATALRAPGRFRSSSDSIDVRAGQVHVTLGPFAYIWVEGDASPVHAAPRGGPRSSAGQPS